MKKILLFLLIFSTSPVVAQQSRLDSLNQALGNSNDTARADIMIEICKEYIGTDRAKAIHYAEQAIKIYRVYENPTGVAYALKNIGLAYYAEGKYAEVLNAWQKSLEEFEQIGDKVGVSNMLSNIGAIYFTQGWDAKAIEYYLQSLTVAEAINDKLRIATALINIGAVYFNNPATHDKALAYYLKALPISKAIGNEAAIGMVSGNIGEIHLAKGEYEQALNYFHSSVEMLTASGKIDKVAYSQNNIAKVYLQRGDLKKAMEYHLQALATAESVSSKLEISQSLIGLANIYNLQGNYQQALTTYHKTREIAQELGAQHELRDAYDGLATAYMQLGDYKNAYEYQRRHLTVKDTLFNIETNQKIVNLQANYESEKQQAQIDLLTKDKALQQLDLQQQTLIKNASLTGLVFILILAFILLRNNQNKKKANRLLLLKNREINEQKEEIASQRDNLEQTYHNLLEAQAQLVQSEKMASLGQLTAGVAHEINNPINFVSAGIDSLRANVADIMTVVRQYLSLNPEEDNKEKLQRLHRLKKEADIEELIEESELLFRSIKNGAVRTTEIVKSLKNFTRLDESSLKKADVHEGIDSTLVILGSQLKDRIKVEKHYGKLPLITCYPGQLNQLFMNILSNAVQAIEGEGTITLNTYCRNGYAVISIKDNGKGMSEEVKKRIFDPFYTTKDVGEGTGLGLSISYGIIEKHKGKIEVESEPGVGTEFKIYVSLDLTEETAAPAKPAPAAVAVPTN
jgi:two-component system NtrC family sensor kinase